MKRKTKKNYEQILIRLSIVYLHYHIQMKTITFKKTISLLKCPKEVDQRIYSYIKVYKWTKNFMSASFFLISKIWIWIFSGFMIGFLSYQFITNSYVDLSSSTDKTNQDIASISKWLKQIDYINSQL